MKILLIEDEIKLARALKKSLELDGYAVTMVIDGDSGLSELMHGDFDAAIIDWMLPGEHDGPGIIAKARKEGVTTPVLIATARDSVKDRVAGLDTGADDYIIKPFSLDELSAGVRALLRRPSTTTTPKLICADLELDPASMRVVRDDQPIELSRKEFSLLEYLLRNQGKPADKQTIIDHVWDFDADILPNTLEAVIKNLRHKIDKPFGRPLIVTVRGVGYKIEDTK